MPARELLDVVLPEVGASRPTRDAVDARLVGHVRNRNGTIINSQSGRRRLAGAEVRAGAGGHRW